MNYLEIESVVGREILDSRGNPTRRRGRICREMGRRPPNLPGTDRMAAG